MAADARPPSMWRRPPSSTGASSPDRHVLAATASTRDTHEDASKAILEPSAVSTAAATGRVGGHSRIGASSASQKALRSPEPFPYRLARATLHDPAEAQDATHDAFVQAWRKWSTLRDPARFEP